MWYLGKADKGLPRVVTEPGTCSKMSYNLNDWDDESTTKSTETLGIDKNENKGREDERFGTGYRKMRTYLVVSVVIIALLIIVCIVLSVFLAKEDRKQQQQKSSEQPPTPSEKPTERGTAEKVYCYSPECLQLAADFARNMNASFDPCVDFFQHSCGSWIKDHPIPPSLNMFDTFLQLDIKNEKRIREMLEEKDQLPEKSAVRKAKRYFKSCLNVEEVEQTAKQSLLPLMAKYGSWALDNQTWNSSEWSWSKLLPVVTRNGVTTPIFSVYLDINPRNSSQHILAVSQ